MPNGATTPSKHLDFRSPEALLRAGLKQGALRVLETLGRYEPAPDLATAQADSMQYFEWSQDRLRPRDEYRVVFNPVPAEFEDARELVYTPAGMAWKNQTLIERYSIRRPSLKEVLDRPAAAGIETIPAATIVQSDFPYTYGDWVHAVLGTLLCSRSIQSPVLIPEFLARKSYVSRDLDQAGIAWRTVTAPICVQNARVLFKRWPYFFWGDEQVEAYRAAYVKKAPADPRPGSVSYLGRFDLVGEVAARNYPSSAVARVIEARGGKIFEQRRLSPEYSAEIASDMEVVIGDHGSGILNMMFWKPKVVIELIVDDWWCNNNLFVAKSLGVEKYAVIPVDRCSEDELGKRLRACLDFFEV